MRDTAARTRCLVYGGSGTVGSEICRVLAREGAGVVFTYRSGAERARALAAEVPGSVAIECDVTDFDEVKRAAGRAADALGGLDAMVYGVGTAGDALFYQCVAPGNYDKLARITCEDFDEMIAVNTRGALAACQAAAPFLRERADGNIVLLGTMDGAKSVPSPIHFAASKSALRGMAESLSKELGNYNIRVNVVSPGILDAGGSSVLPESLTSAYLDICSLRRFGTPREVAEVVAWLATENTYITGQMILLDGGL